MQLSLQTLHILAFSKIIMALFFCAFLFVLYKKNKPWIYGLIFTFFITLFYFVLSAPLQKMFFGNNGDEVFIFAFFTKVLSGQGLRDFYYGWLPAFYPPLYFWAIGFFAKIFTMSAIQATKIGVLTVLSMWFFVPYFMQNFFWTKIKTKNSDIEKNNWFWILLPIIYFLMLDFDTIILKPYETFSALLCCLLLGFIFHSFDFGKWSYKLYLFLGILSGLLFLTYYFWWILILPLLFVLAALSENNKKNLIRSVILSLLIFAVSLIYTIPLALSYLKYGMENWQAVFFNYFDFFTFIPWFDLSLKSVIYLFGLIGLIVFRINKFIKANLSLFIFCYLYQLVNILAFAFGKKPMMAAKPFLFLATACLSFGSAYLGIYIFQNHLAKYSNNIKKTIIIVLMIVFLGLMPFGKFIDNNKTLNFIENDLTESNLKSVADFVRQNIPDFKDRIWLSSGLPEFNAYIPLKYYIAHNPHFSHPASIYSKRLEMVEKLTKSKDAEEFERILNEFEPKPNGLILYSDKNSDFYVLNFWIDNYPNGGKDYTLRLKKDLISEHCWEKKFDSGVWVILVLR